MVDVLVSRPPGDKCGPEITDPLITSDSVAIKRGQREIDASTSTRSVRVTTFYQTGIRRNQVVRILDSNSGEVWQGLVRGISHTKNSTGDFNLTYLDVKRLL